jgi:hypothetical protein
MTAGARWITEVAGFRSMRQGAPDRDTAADDPRSQLRVVSRDATGGSWGQADTTWRSGPPIPGSIALPNPHFKLAAQYWRHMTMDGMTLTQ